MNKKSTAIMLSCLIGCTTMTGCSKVSAFNKNLSISQENVTGTITDGKTTDLSQYKTDYVGDNSKVVHIVSNQIYPEGYSYDHIEIQSEKRPYGLTVYLNSNNGNLTDEEKDILESASEEAFNLIGNVQTINYSNAETSEMIATFNRSTFVKLDKYFKDPHKTPSDDPSLISENYDINGDGKDEKIYLVDAGNQGGDGGYTLYVDDEDGNNLYSADDYKITAVFDKNGVSLNVGEDKIAYLTYSEIDILYEDKQDKTEWDNFKDGDIITGDFISGFTIDKETNTIVTKSLVSTPNGHSDTLGYMLSFISFSDNEIPNVSYKFALSD